MERKLIFGTLLVTLVTIAACNPSITQPARNEGPVSEAPSNPCIDDLRAVRILEQQLNGSRVVRLRFRVEHFCADYTAVVAISSDGVNFTTIAAGTNLTQVQFDVPIWAVEQTRCGRYLKAFVRVSASDLLGIVEETIAPIHEVPCNPPQHTPPVDLD